MQVSSIVLSLFALAGTAIAQAPEGFDFNGTNYAAEMMTVAGESHELSKRVQGGVYLCTDINWGGQCGFAQQPFDVCIQLTSPYYHTISSIGPDPGNALVFSEDNNCVGNAYTLFNPGSSNLVSIGWNDRIGSFRVRQISGGSCVKDPDWYNNPSRLPGINCQRCCNGCTRSGQNCCPDGATC